MKMEAADEILLAGIKDGNYVCFNQLFVRYYSRLCLFVFRFSQNESVSEDVVQELFMKLWTNRQRLKIRENVAGYLYRASKNAVLNYLRAENTRKKTLQNIPVQDGYTNEDLMEQVEFSAALHKCVEQLPERSREVFIKSRFDGLKQQEISDQLGISVKTIKNQIWKSLQYLKSCLELKDAF